MEELKNFLHSIGKCVKDIEEKRKHQEAIEAPNFSLFNFIRNDEIGFSRCLAFLLNVNGSHGQGDLYLNLFLNKFIPEEYLQKDMNLSRANVVIEKGTDEDRRIDIYIEIPGYINIGIENKPWAADQHKQLQDYACFLKRISKNRDWALIYLCNNDPSKESIAPDIVNKLKEEGRFLHVRFSQIVDWLRSCIPDTKAYKVGFFIKDMIKFIDKEINNMVEIPKEEEKIISLLADDHNFNSAFYVIQGLDHMKRQLMEKLKDDLNKTLVGYTICFDNKLFYGSPYSGFSIYKIANQRYKFRFEFDKERFNNLFFGIKDEKSDGGQGSKSREEINRRMCDKFGGGSSNTVWCWWAWIDQISNIIGHDLKNWEDNKTPWISIKDGTLVGRICEITEEVDRALSDIDLLN